jgi:hypothetical protein
LLDLNWENVASFLITNGIKELFFIPESS